MPSFYRLLAVVVASIVFGLALGFIIGTYPNYKPLSIITISDAEQIQEIKNTRLFHIYYTSSGWDISAITDTPCGTQRVETGYQPNLKEAIKTIKQKIECIQTCGCGGNK